MLSAVKLSTWTPLSSNLVAWLQFPQVTGAKSWWSAVSDLVKWPTSFSHDWWEYKSGYITACLSDWPVWSDGYPVLLTLKVSQSTTATEQGVIETAKEWKWIYIWDESTLRQTWEESKRRKIDCLCRKGRKSPRQEFYFHFSQQRLCHSCTEEIIIWHW